MNMRWETDAGRVDVAPVTFM